MNPATPEGRAELWEQLSRAIELRSSQDQVLWTIFGFFGATNAVLLAALFANGAFPDDWWVVVVVAGTGLLVSWLWHRVQARALRHIERHEGLMERIESELKVPPDLAVSAGVDGTSDEQHMGKATPARKVMRQCGWGAALLWGVIAVLYLGKSLGCV